MYKIMIVEDDEIIAKNIAQKIESWNDEAIVVKDFSAVVQEFCQVQPHLVLLDITLPFYNGYYWCTEIRKLSSVPILFISSASDNMNIVMAMNMGADDFIAKPFDLSVLHAKIQAMLRRSYDFSQAQTFLEHRGAILNTHDTTLTYQDQQVELTKNEYKILQILMEEKGRIIPRETLMNRLWQTDTYVDENTLTVNVARLRKKLEEIGLTDFIKTKKGLGYILS